MFAGMAILGGVAAPDVAARDAEAQVHPGIPDGDALGAPPVGYWIYREVREMETRYGHQDDFTFIAMGIRTRKTVAPGSERTSMVPR